MKLKTLETAFALSLTLTTLGCATTQQSPPPFQQMHALRTQESLLTACEYTLADLLDNPKLSDEYKAEVALSVYVAPEPCGTIFSKLTMPETQDIERMNHKMLAYNEQLKRMTALVKSVYMK